MHGGIDIGIPDAPLCNEGSGDARDTVALELSGGSSPTGFGPAVATELESQGWKFGAWATSTTGERHTTATSGGFTISLGYHQNPQSTTLIGVTPCLPGRPDADKSLSPTSTG